MKLSNLQKEEILYRVQLRRETIEDDIESATPFEKTEGNLDALEQKILLGLSEYTLEEKQWLREEFEDLANIADCNINSAETDKEQRQIIGFVNSMNNAVSKL